MSDEQIPPAEPPSQSAPRVAKDRYREVLIVLIALSGLGAVAAIVSALMLDDIVHLDAAVSLAVGSIVLVEVYLRRPATAASRKKSKKPLAPIRRAETPPAPTEPTEAQAAPVAPVESTTPVAAEIDTVNPPAAVAGPPPSAATTPLTPGPWSFATPAWISRVNQAMNWRHQGVAAGLLGVLLMIWLFVLEPPTLLPYVVGPWKAAIAGVIWVCAAGLAAAAARYLGNIDAAALPEASALCRGARVVAWILLIGAASIAFRLLSQATGVTLLHWVVLLINVAVVSGLVWAGRTPARAHRAPLDIGVLSLLGSRTNPAGSVLDSAQRQLGIDLRSTWALAIIRRGVEPLVIGLCIVGWLSTALTVVGVDEQGLVERLGVPIGDAPLEPGLHLHWPWPVDHVFRIPVRRVQSLTIGHEGEEAAGPENVLWAVEHAPNEFTLLLGNGRDLLTIDAAVQFRIRDARAWRYNCQNPAAALTALGYRAVMRSTVNLTLSEALSQNVATLTHHMRTMVQQEADALGLGVEVLDFTVGGMHPPVPVATAYQSVVSAELQKGTAVISAQAYRNATLPAAEAQSLAARNGALAEGAEALGTAAGEAWSFRTLEAQYHASPPQEFFFRRRLEALEDALAGKSVAIVDSRFMKDGGEIWIGR